MIGIVSVNGLLEITSYVCHVTVKTSLFCVICDKLIRIKNMAALYLYELNSKRERKISHEK